MKAPTLTLSPEESRALSEAMQAAGCMHGRNFKTAIHRAWYSGNYSRECLEQHSGVLQRLRNSGVGREWLEAQRCREWVPTKGVAYLMGRDCARGVPTVPDSNPFGVAVLSAAWRKGYADHAPARTLAGIAI